MTPRPGTSTPCAARAQDEWNDGWGRIEVKGGTQQQRTKFYTDLWHVLLGRHKIDDVNGEYPDLTDGQRAGLFHARHPGQDPHAPARCGRPRRASHV